MRAGFHARLFIGLLLLCLGLNLSAAQEPAAPTLRGIVNLSDLRLALLETAPSGPGASRELILAPGQRDGDVFLIAIQPEAGTAQVGSRIKRTWTVADKTPAPISNEPITSDDTNRENRIVSSPRVTPSGTSPHAAEFSSTGQQLITTATNSITVGFQDKSRHLELGGPGILLERAPISQVLGLYQQLSGRTLLIHPSLPRVSFSLNATASNSSEASFALEKEFAGKGIATVPDGDKFIMVVPKSHLAAARPRSSEIRPASPPTRKANTTTDESIPPGVMNFWDVHPSVVAEIYAELLGRKVDREAPLPQTTATLTFKTQTPLSREEVCYAFDVLFAWQGLKMVPSGGEFLKLVAIPASER